MEKNDFTIGLSFYTATGKWRCTDVGARVVVAIELNQKDEKNYIGPPYSICEIVFDENDFEGCSLNICEFEDNISKLTKSKKLDDIHSALIYVSSSGFGENTAIYDKETGKIYLCSDMAGIDEFEEFCESQYNEKIHIDIPHKNDLALGRNLVFEFMRKHSPENENVVSQIFRKKGAYSKFKNFLDSKNILQKWYDFENSRELEELNNWCQENNIDIS